MNQTPLLMVNDLVKHFQVKAAPFQKKAKVQAVDGVSFELVRGETLGIVGESGCGKSTTARVLMQLMPPDKGQIVIEGKQVGSPTGMSVREMRFLMQMVFQDSYASLNPRLTIEETIAFGPQVHGVAFEEANARARDLLGKVGLDPNLFIRRYPHELSGGQRQRVKLAQAIAHDPAVVLLDEPTDGLDPEQRDEMLRLIRTVATEFGISVILSSHLLDEVERVCDAAVIIGDGRTLASGSLDALRGSGADVVLELDTGHEATLIAERLVERSLPHQLDGRTIVVRGDDETAFDITRDICAAADVSIHKLSRRRLSLEDVFLERAS